LINSKIDMDTYLLVVEMLGIMILYVEFMHLRNNIIRNKLPKIGYLRYI
jgi:hypothetical protein